jgi:hypothetical protein
MMRFVLSITPTVSADGSTLDFLFSGDSWATSPTDTPPNKSVMGLLKNPGTLRRELFAGQRVTGAIRPSFGNVVLANPAPVAGEPGLLDDWIDYGMAGADVVLYWGEVGAAFPAGYTVVYRAFCHSFWADADVITIRLRDALQLLEQPVVSEGFAGTGGLEGTGAVAKRKQFVSGDPGFIEPILVDAIKQIYFVQTTATAGLESAYLRQPDVDPNAFDVYDNGVKITRAETAYASSTDLLASAPSAGYVKYWYGPDNQSFGQGGDGPVYFRLGSPPAGDLRVFAMGYPTDADAQRLGAVWGTLTAAHVALRAGVSSANVSRDSSPLPVIAALVDDDRTYLDLLSDQALAVQGWFGFDRLGVFRSGFLQDPVEAEPTPASVYEFTESSIGGLRREPVAGMEAPVWSVAVTAGDTWPSQIAGGASSTLRDYLSRKVWASASGRSSATKVRDPGAEHQTVKIRGRFMQNSFGITRWMERYFQLYGGVRHFYSFSAPMSADLLAIDLHDVVTLTHSRFGLSAGKNYRVVSITIDCAAAVPTMKFVVWGGEPGVYDGVQVTTPGAAFVDPLAASSTIGLFTGYMAGSVSVASSTSVSGSAQTTIGDFSGVFAEGVPYYANDASAIAVVHNSHPYVSVYPWSGSFGAKISDPATGPAGQGMGVAFSPAGDYVAVAHWSSPYVTAYPWTGAFGAKVSNPATLPPSSANGVAFSPAGDHIAVAHEFTPYVSVYPWTGAFGAKVSNPATLPTGTAYSVAFSPAGDHIAVAHTNSPYVSVYPWTGAFGTKVSNPTTMPAGTGRGVAFSPSGGHIAVAHTTTPNVSVYPWTGAFGTKVADPATLPAADGKSVAFSAAGDHIAVAHNTSPYVSVYPWTGAFGAKVSDPATLPTTGGTGVAFSPADNHIAVTHAGTPYVSVYPWTGAFGAKVSDPATLPNGVSNGVAFCPL